MRIGVPRETKDGERRVGVTVDGVRALVADGHTVTVDSGAGAAVGFSDDAYRDAGAHIAATAEAVWASDLVVKVKEVQPGEYGLLHPGSTIFGFHQINRDPALLDALLRARVAVVGYETVRDAEGRVPLLAPMSRIAGRLAPLAGADALSTARGGSGVLLSGVDDVPGARVVVIGAGNVGGEAARIAARMGAQVTVLSRGEARRAALVVSLAAEGHPIRGLGVDEAALAAHVRAADLVIGAVLEPGKLSPKLLSRALVSSMRPGSAIVDVGIDQGGIAETSRMTKITEPTYVECGVVHYAVPNMPSLVARTATLALAAATLPFARRLAAGIDTALAADPGLMAGLMVRDGDIVHAGLAADARRRAAQAAA